MTDLEELAGLSESDGRLLKQASIRSVESLAIVGSTYPDRIRRLLGHDWRNLRNAALSQLGAGSNALDPAEVQRYALGATEIGSPATLSVDALWNDPAAFLADSEISPGFEALPPRGSLPEPRDQGKRGTCVGHAFSALTERALGYDASLLSPQFAYWAAKQQDSIRSEGTTLGAAVLGAERFGICGESLWPYNPGPCADRTCGEPTREVLAAAIENQGTLARSSPPNEAVESILAELAAGRWVACCLSMYDTWWNPLTQATGEVILPLPGSQNVGGHAVVLVGGAADVGFAGGGYFVFRNSWGATWASQSAFAAGYGLLPFAYVANFCWEAFVQSDVT